MRDCDVNILRRVRAHPGGRFNGSFHCVLSVCRFCDLSVPWQMRLLERARELVRCLVFLSKYDYNIQHRNCRLHGVYPRIKRRSATMVDNIDWEECFHEAGARAEGCSNNHN